MQQVARYVGINNPRDGACFLTCTFLYEFSKIEKASTLVLICSKRGRLPLFIVTFPIIFKLYHTKRRFSDSYKIQVDIKIHKFYSEIFITFYFHSLISKKQKPPTLSHQGFIRINLAVTYSHMGISHTTIGITAFHF